MLRELYIINHKNHERLILLYVFILQAGKRRLGEVNRVARGPNSDLCDPLASCHDTVCQAPKREEGHNDGKPRSYSSWVGRLVQQVPTATLSQVS